LTIKERVKGKDAIDCATTLNNIGSVYKNKGDYEQALLHYQRCLTIQERVKGKDAIDCATTLYNISFVYSKLKQNELAKSAAERSYKISLKILGEQHFKTKNRAKRWKKLC
jgi:tetratricopeptide (TPR) repeat protein